MCLTGDIEQADYPEEGEDDCQACSDQSVEPEAPAEGREARTPHQDLNIPLRDSNRSLTLYTRPTTRMGAVTGERGRHF